MEFIGDVGVEDMCSSPLIPLKALHSSRSARSVLQHTSSRHRRVPLTGKGSRCTAAVADAAPLSLDAGRHPTIYAKVSLTLLTEVV